MSIVLFPFHEPFSSMCFFSLDFLPSLFHYVYNVLKHPPVLLWTRYCLQCKRGRTKQMKANQTTSSLFFMRCSCRYGQSKALLVWCFCSFLLMPLWPGPNVVFSPCSFSSRRPISMRNHELVALLPKLFDLHMIISNSLVYCQESPGEDSSISLMCIPDPCKHPYLHRIQIQCWHPLWESGAQMLLRYHPWQSHHLHCGAGTQIGREGRF